MNKKTFSVILLLSAATAAYISADPRHNWKEFGENWGDAKKIAHKKIDNNTTLYGTIMVDDVHVSKNFTCYGSALVNNSSIKGVATIYGPLKAHQSQFSQVDVRCSNEQHDIKGIVRLSDVQIGKLLIKGKLEAQKSSIKHITTFSGDMVLTDSRVDSIVMMNNTNGQCQKAAITLNNTVVEGDIIFSQKGGTVICSGTAHVKGRISGGTLIKN